MPNFNDEHYPKPIPLPKVHIPQTWSSTQALCVIEFLHAIADEIWDWHGRPILDLLDRKNSPPYDLGGNTRPRVSQKNTDNDDENFPF